VLKGAITNSRAFKNIEIQDANFLARCITNQIMHRITEFPNSLILPNGIAVAVVNRLPKEYQRPGDIVSSIKDVVLEVGASLFALGEDRQDRQKRNQNKRQKSAYATNGPRY
jgi:hypothetical protein